MGYPMARIIVASTADISPPCHRVHPPFRSETQHNTTQHKVFKGLNESTGELFAVKQISLTRGLKEEINTLETEIDLMKDLDHRYGTPPHRRFASCDLPIF